ncbi:MAG: ABC transporter permease [Acidimicrobiales bacterium]|nr:ABC transporter permease [Acidimicrobiales bacterium]
MTRLVLRWLLKAVLLMFLVSALTFVLVSLTPGDPARTILGPQGTQAQYDALRLQMGLDEPLHVRYLDWLSDAVRGDLGSSLFNGESVTSLLRQRLGVTITLVVGGVVCSAVLGIALGVLSARRRGAVARTVDVLSLVGSAIPSFWFGLVLATLFAVKLGWFPVVGYTPFSESVPKWAESVVLPIATLALSGIALVAKQTRDAMLQELDKDYVLMLRAHGASEVTVQLKHALRNAAVPIITVVGVLMIGLLGGTVLVESVFTLPGLGGLAVTRTFQHDLPVIQGVAVLFAGIVVAINLFVDLAYAWANPKVRT